MHSKEGPRRVKRGEVGVIEVKDGTMNTAEGACYMGIVKCCTNERMWQLNEEGRGAEPEVF